MATMQITKEVEVTAEVVIAALAAFAEGEADSHIAQFQEHIAAAAFPAAVGDLIKLTPVAAGAFEALPDMPARVLAIAPGQAMALVVYCTARGTKTARISALMVAGPF